MLWKKLWKKALKSFENIILLHVLLKYVYYMLALEQPVSTALSIGSIHKADILHFNMPNKIFCSIMHCCIWYLPSITNQACYVQDWPLDGSVVQYSTWHNAYAFNRGKSNRFLLIQKKYPRTILLYATEVESALYCNVKRVQLGFSPQSCRSQSEAEP